MGSRRGAALCPAVDPNNLRLKVSLPPPFGAIWNTLMRGAPSHPSHAHTAAYAELQRLLERLSRRIGAPQIFADFVELSSIALSNAVGLIDRLIHALSAGDWS